MSIRIANTPLNSYKLYRTERTGFNPYTFLNGEYQLLRTVLPPI
jgi:hypothetical protein